MTLVPHVSVLKVLIVVTHPLNVTIKWVTQQLMLAWDTYGWAETLSVETDHGSGDITGVSLKFTPTDACPSVRLGLGGSWPGRHVSHWMHISQPAHQIFTLWFTVVTLQLWSRNEVMSWLGVSTWRVHSTGKVEATALSHVQSLLLCITLCLLLITTHHQFTTSTSTENPGRIWTHSSHPILVEILPNLIPCTTYI